MLVYDIETNSIDFSLPDPPTDARIVHCLVIVDDDGRATRYNDQGKGAPPIEEGVARLVEAPDIGGHNVCGFDQRVLKYLYGFEPRGRVWDSLVISEMYYGTDLRWRDAQAAKKGRPAPAGRLVGRHSLEAWGIRLGFPKDDYAARCKAGEYGPVLAKDPFSFWNQAMEDYCEQDTRANQRLFGLLRDRGAMDTRAARMECELAPYLKDITARGWTFDEAGAQRLASQLAAERMEIRARLIDRFGSFYLPDGQLFTPKRDNKSRGYVAGAELQKVKLTEFNPSSDAHIARMLTQHYGWKPKVFTDTGLPSVTEEVLKSLDYPEAPDLCRYAMLDKRLGQIMEGNKAWLRFVRDGRLHGSFRQNGTRTGRMSHTDPNMAQVPKVGTEYGAECRALFVASPGLVMVGADAAGIEMRMLGHFTAKFDGGALAQELLTGDVHTANQQAIGLNVRDAAKTFIYALLYGAGDPKLGRTIWLDMTPEQRKDFGAVSAKKLGALGKRARASIMERFPGLGELDKRVRRAAAKGRMPGIDGRVMTGVSQHNGLNTLLQGTAGVLMKAAVLRVPPAMRERGLAFNQDAWLVGHIHDEMQGETRPEVGTLFGESMVAAIRQTGEDYELRVPLDGEFKIGASWADTH